MEEDEDDNILDNDCLLTIFSFVAPDIGIWKFTTVEDRENHRARVKLMLVCCSWLKLVKSKMKTWNVPGETPFLNFFRWERLSSILNFSHTVDVSNIQHLGLRMCLDLTDDIIQSFVNKCHKIVSIDLSYCYLVTDGSIKAIASSVHNKTLTTLNLEMCKRITNIGVKLLAEKCINLTTLNISELPKIDDDGLIALSTLPSLQHIELNFTSTMYHQGNSQSWSCIYCGVFYNLEVAGMCTQCDNVHIPNVTNTGTIQLAKKGLITASFRGRVRVDGGLVAALAGSCPELTHVDLGWCNVDMSSIEQLVKQCKSLKSVHVSRLGKGSWNDFDSLKKLFPSNTEVQVQQRKLEPEVLKQMNFDYTGLAVGDKVLVLDTVYKWYLSRILERETKNGVVHYLVHYDGWSKKWDEYINSAERFAPIPLLWASPF